MSTLKLLLSVTVCLCYLVSVGAFKDDSHTCLSNATSVKTRLDRIRGCKGEDKKCNKVVSYKEIKLTQSCCKGYNLDRKTDSCKPKCKFGCIGGTCVAPDTCECPAPLVLVENRCENVTCSPECGLNAVCHNNTCICETGYENEDDSCLPKCENCNNGNCTAPGECNCDSGYTLLNGTCTPFCSKDCQNGFCAAPETCSCHDKYLLDPDDAYKCKPYCERCVNGSCTSPDICTCNEGYEHDDSNTCRPTCSPGCENGTCVAPDICQCSPGYVLVDNLCKPECKSCRLGNCVAPDICQCSEGYDLVDQDCAPICEGLCVNGDCTAPNKCTCDDGFVKNDSDPLVCYKECQRPCYNGQCNMFGECVCSSGYENLNDTCVEMTPENCFSCQNDSSNGNTTCDDGRPCYFPLDAKAASTTSLAGLQLSWAVGGALALLLVLLLLLVLHRMWTTRRDHKPAHTDPVYSSVMYTVPDTLLRKTSDCVLDEPSYDELPLDDQQQNNPRLLHDTPHEL